MSRERNAQRERSASPTGYYHVMQRGAGKQILFEDERDCERYLGKLSESKAETGVRIVAYCLMYNHVHLLVWAESVEVLSRFMRKIGTCYAKWYNIRYEHAGYVFQGRFLSETICDESYLLSCMRYIHNNPVKAGLGARDEYRWSSYNEYFGTKRIVDEEIVEEMIGSKTEFERFSESADDRVFMEMEVEAATCMLGQEIVRMHFGNEFDNCLLVKQLCVRERNRIIKEMKAAGLSNHQIEMVTGVSRDIVRRVVIAKGNE